MLAFCANIFAPKITKLKRFWRKVRKALLFKKLARKMLMKSTPEIVFLPFVPSLPFGGIERPDKLNFYLESVMSRIENSFGDPLYIFGNGSYL